MDGLDRAALCHAQPMLDLGECLLDRIEVWGVGRQERELGAGREDRVACCLRSMATEVVEDDDVARVKLRNQELLDVGAEDDAIDRSVDDAWRGERIGSESGEEREGAPAAVGAKPVNRSPLMPQPRIGAMLVLIQVSSMKTRRCGSR